MSAPWITYRPEVKVLDCTIRDGGLMNAHRFSDDFVREVYRTCLDAGVDYMEIGYKHSDRIFARDQFGTWKFCREDDIRRVIDGLPEGIDLSVMIDAGKSDWRDIPPRRRSVISTMRVAFYNEQLPEAVDMIRDAHEKGYEVWANLMAVTTIKETDIDRSLEILAGTPVTVLVVVDSFGSMYTESVEYLVKKYLRFGKESCKEVGIHAHNNQQLAFANSIEAIRQGANFVDASIGGLGRGAGNCPMELILGFLHNPRYRLRPVVSALETLIEPIRTAIDWGPSPEYNITGIMNRHPRDAMEVRENPEQRGHYLEFYDRMNALRTREKAKNV